MTRPQLDRRMEGVQRRFADKLAHRAEQLHKTAAELDALAGKLANLKRGGGR